VRIYLFIGEPQPCALLFLLCGVGDDRGFDEFAHRSRNRVAIKIDFNANTIDVTSNPSCSSKNEGCKDALPWVVWPCDWNDSSCPEPKAAHKNSSWLFLSEPIDALGIQIAARNSLHAHAPAIDDAWQFSPFDPSLDIYRSLSVTGIGDAFPSVEMYEEYADGAARTLGLWREDTIRCLGFPVFTHTQRSYGDLNPNQTC
jgi:hypothetical protein